MKNLACFNRTIAAVGLACLGIGTSDAAMVDYQISTSTALLESFNISYNTSGNTLNNTDNGAYVGGIQISRVTGGTQPLSAFPSTYTTVCTDVGNIVYMGDTYGYDLKSFSGQAGLNPLWGYNATTIGGTGTQLTGATLQGEQALAIQNAAHIFYSEFSNLGTGATASQNAAVQLAVWAALYNTTISGQITGFSYSGGNGSISGGRLAVSGADQAAINLAASWLNAINTGGTAGNYGLTGNLLYPNPTTQNGAPVQELLIRTQDATPVPEASTMVAGVLLLLPFGASTLRMFRKNRTT
ncbi:MAG: hypothetical protein P4L87_15660 [Formivibrio sp.]|nr:hypothetical protein [Formivibrio sp.]